MFICAFDTGENLVVPWNLGTWMASTSIMIQRTANRGCASIFRKAEGIEMMDLTD